VLLAMIDEVAATYRLRPDRFLLFGFSGGGHFAHRFAYLHPQRLLAVAVGAPGSVTLLRDDRDYWVGTRNVEQVFGRPVDLGALRRVPVLLVIGGEDTETWEITIPRDSPNWMPGASDAGANRLERMASLRASLEAHDVDVQQVIVPGVGHEAARVLEPVKAFFSTALARSRPA
jgi:pimeloyl-ACP methyl ester carboxylesterase